jgi:hypothetical protein
LVLFVTLFLLVLFGDCDFKILFYGYVLKPYVLKSVFIYRNNQNKTNMNAKTLLSTVTVFSANSDNRVKNAENVLSELNNMLREPDLNKAIVKKAIRIQEKLINDLYKRNQLN